MGQVNKLRIKKRHCTKTRLTGDQLVGDLRWINSTNSFPLKKICHVWEYLSKFTTEPRIQLYLLHMKWNEVCISGSTLKVFFFNSTIQSLISSKCSLKKVALVVIICYANAPYLSSPRISCNPNVNILCRSNCGKFEKLIGCIYCVLDCCLAWLIFI